ncbi:hypothetical protein CP532_5394 [Ophiocordyceps camponoti-leonardi (nom. inval.)]|nr:hypothetical protein CP532_5394 [Ophiocordyceps camponoti-leonardi (nom. inval.)]
MKNLPFAKGLFGLLAFIVGIVRGHSWIESAFVIAPNGSYIGAEGFPRGYIPRTDPAFNDKQAQHLIPDGAFYSGNEVLNKFPPSANNPQFPLLQAAPGQRVAINHLENGHVTLPQNQANKPLNRGTVFLYGTAQPMEQEKLFDVHLRWNQDGSGGDRRGRLLATRNYDDGQCYQDNKQPIAQERVSRLAADGASLDRELRCQSIITIPTDVKPGSVYTVYWYWDWPTLNPAKIDMQNTQAGRFPWAGSFMRGDKVPDGWTMGAIAINESYSSVMDIKIVEPLPGLVAKQGDVSQWITAQNVYSAGVQGQGANGFDVKVDDYIGGAAGPAPAPATAPASAPVPSQPGGAVSPSPSPPLPSSPVPSSAPAVSTVSAAVRSVSAPDKQPCPAAATTLVTTTTVYVKGQDANPSSTPVVDAAALEPSTVMVTVTTHVPAAPSKRASRPQYGARDVV